MKQKYVLIDAEGMITAAGFGYAPPDSIIVAAMTPLDVLVHMFVDGENGLVSRPTSPAPTLDGTICAVPPCPLGTQITVADIIGDEILFDHEVLNADALSLYLTDGGEYEITVTAPAPHLPSSMRFSV